MNVLFLSYGTGLYGANRALLNLIHDLKNVHNIKSVILVREPSVFTARLDELGVEYLVEKWTNWIYTSSDTLWVLSKPYDFVKIIYRIFQNIFYNYKTYRRVSQLNKLIKFDIIHSNTGIINTGLYLAKKLKIPHVMHFREFVQEDYGFKYIYGNKWTFKYISLNTKAAVSVSNSVYNKFSNCVQVDKFINIYDGLRPIESSESGASKKSNMYFDVLLAGLLHPGKGQLDALKALAYLMHVKSITNIRLNIVGDGDPSYLQELKNFTVENNIADNVIFWGYRKDLSSIRRAMHIAIVTSRMEAFGLVTLEAMFAGLPVIGVNAGGTAELILDGVTGYTYRNSNYQELAECIVKFINDPVLISNFGLSGFQRAVKYFNNEAHCNAIYKLYREICEI